MKPERKRPKSFQYFIGVDVQRKKCPTCGEIKSPQSFGIQAHTPDGLRPTCRLCRGRYDSRRRRTTPTVREYQRKWQQANRDKVRAHQLKTKFAITPAEYDQRLAEQGGGCAICKMPPHPNGLRLAVDHDHSCCPGKKSCGRCIRGLLCSNCNRHRLPAIEDLEWYAAAVEYLSKHASTRRRTA